VAKRVGNPNEIANTMTEASDLVDIPMIDIAAAPVGRRLNQRA